MNSKEARICAAIARSGQFDAAWYLAQNRDVAESGLDPLVHYVRFGEAENRRPAPGFDLEAMRRHYACSSHVLYDHIIAGERTGATVTAANTIPVVFACNENYAPYLSVAIASLIANAGQEYNYDVYIFHTSISDHTISILKSQGTDNVRIIPTCVAAEAEEIVSKAFVHAHFTTEAYFRILIIRILKNINKCIYLDCDLVINSCLSDLYILDIDNYLLAAARETQEDPCWKKIESVFFKEPIEYYFNSGVLLINLSYFRLHEYYEEFMTHIRSGIKYYSVDQDILNIICNHKVKYLPLSWNYMWQYEIRDLYRYSRRGTFKEFCLASPNIVHYNSYVKPWTHKGGKLGALFWRYARLSPFYDYIRSRCPYDPESLQ